MTFIGSTAACLPMMRSSILISADMGTLRAAADLDWSAVEPAIFGTLFERSLDPGKRSQLGAHYTSKEDILLIVEPVVIGPAGAPLAGSEDRGSGTRGEAAQRGVQKAARTNKLRAQLQDKLLAWVEELSKVRILDPACGSGNFLYVALRRMLDLWHEARIFAAAAWPSDFLGQAGTPVAALRTGNERLRARTGIRGGVDWLSAMAQSERHRLAYGADSAQTR